MKISLSQTTFFERDGFNGRIYIKGEDKKCFNALQVECLTRHYKTKLKNAVRAYLVLEGEGVFIINAQEEKALPGDLFVISDGEIYEYEGKMKLFEFNVPATSSANEEKLE